MIVTKVLKVSTRNMFLTDRFRVLVADTVSKEIGVTSFSHLDSALKFANACLLPDDVECSECDGKGEVCQYESVWFGEPHQALVGTRKCICQIDDFIE